MAAAGAGRGKEVKVTHIVTREVSVDEASFKDVVQRLTGKDSAPARAEMVASAGGASGRSNAAAAAEGVFAGAEVASKGVEADTAAAAAAAAAEGSTRHRRR